MILLSQKNRMLGYELLSSCSNISHFVTTRQGGFSQGKYESFNCSPYCKDEPSAVFKNQALLWQELSYQISELILPIQTHHDNVRIIDEAFLAAYSEERLELLNGVDALITDQPNCCICVATADCVPILLFDKKNNVVAAVHAGWRGTVCSILSKTLKTMYQTFGSVGEDIIACIGPSISLKSFEVGAEVYQAFAEKRFNMSRIASFNASTQKYHIDLWEANKMQLQLFGVPSSQIELAGICTYISHDTFFSARRLGIHSGRNLSGIMINSK